MTHEEVLQRKRDGVQAQERRLRRLNLAAEYAGQSSRTLRRRIAEGTLTGYRLGNGRHVFVDLNEIDEELRPIPTLAAGA